jgi:hypothetical protein
MGGARSAAGEREKSLASESYSWALREDGMKEEPERAREIGVPSGDRNGREMSVRLCRVRGRDRKPIEWSLGCPGRRIGIVGERDKLVKE